MATRKRKSGGTAGARRDNAAEAALTGELPTTAEHAGITQGGPGRPFAVVGLGASAGGLEALSEFFAAMKADSGMAFVVVSHLDPEHKSALAEILAKATRMPVTEVRDRMAVEANRVYVIPPNTEMVIADGILSLSPRPGGRLPPMPIDAFLCSLAAERKSQAIGVILSGTGTDGTRGLKAIKTEGGITFAQDETARHEGMPRSAVLAGCVDAVLPPAGTAAALLRIGQCPYPDPQDGEATGMPRQPGDEDDFQAILQLLSRATQVEFTHYKQSTLWRRTQRRMMLRRLATLAEYLACLRLDGQEMQALFEEVLLQVSGFFRDPEVYEALGHTVFPALLADRPPSVPIRIWVPGCATGEEVYSLAMCLLETQEQKSARVPIKFFATDISDKALAAARAGEYAEHAVADVSPQRLRRFFEKTADGYRIQNAVRDLCVFARQDVTRDPPFSQLDLISCRNLLIYLGLPLQARVLPMFHYALKPGGVLVLGTSETVGSYTELFAAIDSKHKIFRRTASLTRLAFDFAPGIAGRTPATIGDEAGPPGIGGPDIRKEADRIMLARYAPCGVVVDEQLRIVQFRGHTGAFLEPAPGTPTLDLFQMARPGLLAHLRDVLEKAQRSHQAARREGIRLTSNGQLREFNLEIVPIALPASGQRYYVILFEEHLAPSDRGQGRRVRVSAPAAPDKDPDKARLNDELAATRQYLQSIIEGKEAANEELKAANEEIVSSNEELQSTNEELETAKEELQATNEELTTVNDELQNRIRVAAQLSDDLANLIDSVNIPTLVVGADLRLRRFSPSSQRVLNLIPADVGRSVGDFKLKINLPDFEPLIHEVLDTLAIKEQEVTDQHGCWYRMVIRPYRTTDNRIDGAVITLMDIDLMKRRDATLRASEERFRMLVDHVRDHAIFFLDAEGRVATWNQRAEQIKGYRAEEIVGQHIRRFYPPEDVLAGKPEHYLETARQRGHCESEGWRVRKDGSRFWANVVTTPLRDEAGELRGFAKIVQDVTQRKELENQLLETATREQQRIGQDLHDSVGQELTGLGLLAESLVEALAEQSHPDADLATKITGGIRRVLGQVRALAQGLIPVEVDATGLMTALRDFATRINEHPGVTCTFTCVEPVAIDDNPTATHLYRIAQEAVTNALRHGRPHQIQLSLAADAGHIRLQIADDGIGMSNHDAAVGSMGMRIMRHRAGLIGAALSIESVPGHGTVVACTLDKDQSHEPKQA